MLKDSLGSLKMNRVLLAGWFSFEEMGASAGDIMARDLACAWLETAGYQVDVAVVPPFVGQVDWRSADPAAYSHIVFVCGPFGNGEPITPFLERFHGIPLVGLDLSMLEPLDSWNPFQLLLERDSSRAARPDISFLSTRPLVPVVGTVLIDNQDEYGKDARQSTANQAIQKLLAAREVAVVPIDTRLDVNKTGLRTAAEIETLIARMDVVVTTRLHGTVLALKNGVPAVVIDSVAGGAKVYRQARSIGWPIVFRVEDLRESTLAEAFDYCLTPEARSEAVACCQRAQNAVAAIREEFIAGMISSSLVGARRGPVI
jgi:hypothetical protein